MAKKRKRLKVSLAFKRYNADRLVTFSFGVWTGMNGNVFFPNPPKDPADIKTTAEALSVVNGHISKGDKSPSTKKRQYKLINDLIDLLEPNAHHVEGVASATAKDDLLKAAEIIDSSGYKHIKARKNYSRSLKAKGKGSGCVQIEAKKAATETREYHGFKIGTTDKKDVPPLNFDTWFCQEADIFLSDYESGSIGAVCHTSILPVTYDKNPKSANFRACKGVTFLPYTEKGHPVFSRNVPDPYNWSDWIYFVFP
jgi:hypothetical protein